MSHNYNTPTNFTMTIYMYNRNKHEYCISNAWKNENDVLQEPIIKNSRRGRSVKQPRT